MPTFLQVVNIIRDTAYAQPNVNTVVREFLDLNREDTKYSAVVIQDRDGLRDRISEQDWNTYTFHLGYVDRLRDDESNRDDIFSTGINIINNIISSIRETWFPDVEVNIIDRFQTFNQRFTASCAGVYVVLAIQVAVPDCVDGSQTDIYDSFETRISQNGAYHFTPSGRPVDEINITVDVSGGGEKPEESLVETISSNGSYHYEPSAGSVFGEADITVDVPVKTEESLIQEISANGSYHYDPEEGSVFRDADITVDVHPSTSLVETITSNGTTSFSGEWKDAAITVAVPSDAKPETVCDQIIEENGSFHYTPASGEVFSDVHITTNVHPSMSLVQTISSNGSYSYPGEWNGAEITVAIPSKIEGSVQLGFTTNGSETIVAPSGYVWTEATITVEVPTTVTVTMTQAEYDALAVKDPNTIYLING